jgi:hypothetical protein
MTGLKQQLNDLMIENQRLRDATSIFNTSTTVVKNATAITSGREKDSIGVSTGNNTVTWTQGQGKKNFTV